MLHSKVSVGTIKRQALKISFLESDLVVMIQTSQVLFGAPSPLSFWSHRLLLLLVGALQNHACSVEAQFVFLALSSRYANTVVISPASEKTRC